MTEPWPTVEAHRLHRTQGFSALGFSFSVGTDEAALARHLDVVLQSLAATDRPRHHYDVIGRGHLDGSVGPYRITLDGVEVAVVPSPDLARDHLLWHINRQVIERTDDLVLVHAGAVACRQGGVVLPAPSGAGKSTMVAALIRAGMGYLTDEAVAINPATLELQPYPKPLGLDRGALEALATLEPPFHEAEVSEGSTECHVPPTAVRAGALASPCPPALVITPCYRPGLANRIVPLPRAQALVLLVQSSFNLASFGAAGFLALAELVRRSDCFRLEFSDLSQACDLVAGAASRAPELQR